ncbi:MAG: TIGR01777 family oxidoreductase [Epsilonproteobacteria bacterium]|nr:TIGR01777 family oxidoreductase [Campylobacterota bacterium]
MKKISIIGAKGFVGSAMQTHFKNAGFEVLPLDRAYTKKSITEMAEILEGTDIVINLAGAPIIKRWSEFYKKVLYESRIDTTQKLISAMKLLDKKPEVFCSTSAIGIYESNEPMSESSFTYADNFLAHICKDWEAAALEADELTRVVIFRFGVILGKDGGALSKMLPPFKLGIAGPIGDGSDAFSWIHMNDLLAAFSFAIDNTKTKGAYNLTAPNPITNKILTKTIGKILHRPTVLPLPKFVLKFIFSEGAMVLTEGQYVIPQRLLDEGFDFQYPTIDEALQEIL